MLPCYSRIATTLPKLTHPQLLWTYIDTCVNDCYTWLPSCPCASRRASLVTWTIMEAVVGAARRPLRMQW